MGACRGARVAAALGARSCGRPAEARDAGLRRRPRAAGRPEPRFQPPADGLLTDAQLDRYLQVRRAAGAGSDAEAARARRRPGGVRLGPGADQRGAARARRGQVATRPPRPTTRRSHAMRETRASARDPKTRPSTPRSRRSNASGPGCAGRRPPPAVAATRRAWRPDARRARGARPVTLVEEFLADEIEAGSFPGRGGPGRDAEKTSRRGVRRAMPASSRTASRERGTPFRPREPDQAALRGSARGAAGGGLHLGAAPGRFLPGVEEDPFRRDHARAPADPHLGAPGLVPALRRRRGPDGLSADAGGDRARGRPGRARDLQRSQLPASRRDPGAVLGAPLDRRRSTSSSPIPRERGTLSFLRTRRAAATERDDRFERAMTEARGLSYAGFRDGSCGARSTTATHSAAGASPPTPGSSATARDVWRLARMWLDPARPGRHARPDAGSLGGAGARVAGPPRRRVGDPEMSPRAFGHTGFTGTSVWVDPDADLVCVLLTNRIHPEVREIPFNEVRQRFHAAAYRAFA